MNIKENFKKIKEDSLYRNAFYLMLSNLVLTGFGFFFWMINARLYSTEQVGLATTMISAMSLIISFSAFGFGNSLVRFLPKSANKNNKINTFFTLNFLASIVAATIFLLGISVFSPKLAFIRHNLYFSIAFILIVAFWGSYALIGSVYTAYRENQFNLLQSGIFSIFKLIFPFALIGLGAFGIFASWGIAAIIAFIFGLFILIFKNGFRLKPAIYDSVLKNVWRFSSADYISAFIAGAPALIVPLMITNIINPESTAFYYIAMTLFGLVTMISSSIGNSLFAEGSNNEASMQKQLRKAIKFTALLVIPAILILVFIGKYLLLLYGPEYTQAYSVLKIIAFSGVFVSVRNLYVSTLNIKKQIKKKILVNVVVGSIILITSYIMLVRGMGIEAVAYAWTFGHASVLFFLIPTKRKRKEKKEIKK